MEPQAIFLGPETYSNIRKNSVTVSSRSPGCSTAIESLIPTLTARVLQLYLAMPTRAGVFTTVTQKICNYWPMNKIILGVSHDRPGRTNCSGTGISLGEEMLTFRSRLR